MTVSILTGNIVRKARSEGFGAVVRAVRDRLVETNAATWYYLPLTANVTADERPATAATTFALQRTGDIEAWLLSLKPRFGHAFNEHEMGLARRLEHPVVVARRDGKPVAYVKMAVKQAWVTDFNRTIELPSRLAFIYDSFVYPDYRGAGLARDTVRFAASEMDALGYDGLACHIPDWNIASIKTYRRCGFLPIGHLRYLRVGSLTTSTDRAERMLADAHGQFSRG